MDCNRNETDVFYQNFAKDWTPKMERNEGIMGRKRRFVSQF